MSTSPFAQKWTVKLDSGGRDITALAVAPGGRIVAAHGDQVSFVSGITGQIESSYTACPVASGDIWIQDGESIVIRCADTGRFKRLLTGGGYGQMDLKAFRGAELLDIRRSFALVKHPNGFDVVRFKESPVPLVRWYSESAANPQLKGGPAELAVFDNGGMRIAVVAEGVISVVDKATGETLRAERIPEGSRVEAIAWDRLGRRIAVSLSGGRAMVWAWAKGRLEPVVVGGGARVERLESMGNGAWLSSGAGGVGTVGDGRRVRLDLLRGATSAAVALLGKAFCVGLPGGHLAWFGERASPRVVPDVLPKDEDPVDWPVKRWSMAFPGAEKVALLPSGDAVVAHGRFASLLARDSGERLGTIPTCLSDSVLIAPVGPWRAAVVCKMGVGSKRTGRGQGTILVVDFAQDTAEVAAVLPSRVWSGVWRPGVMLLESDLGALVVDMNSWQSRELTAPHAALSPSRGFALSPDGRRALIMGFGGFATVALDKMAWTAFVPSPHLECGGLAISNDGRRAFMRFVGEPSALLDPTTGERLQQYDTSNRVENVMFLDDGTVFLSGRRGVGVYGDRYALLSVRSIGGVRHFAATGDLSAMCVVAREVSCWSRASVAPSTFRAPNAAARGHVVLGAGGFEMPARLVQRTRYRLVLDLEGPVLLKPGVQARIWEGTPPLDHRAVRRGSPFGRVVVVSVEGQRVTVKVDFDGMGDGSRDRFLLLGKDSALTIVW